MQHGIATSGGAELLTHHVQLLLQDNPHSYILKTDVRNAFNSVSRECLLNETKSTFPEIYAHALQMYGGTSSLVYVKGQEVHIIPSEEGVQQGDPLGPTLFATALHPVINEIQESHQETTVLAYLDDVYITGPVDCVLSALTDFKSSLSSIGLKICDKKCELFCPAGLGDISTSVPVASNGISILGTPIGSTEFVQAQCVHASEGGHGLCLKLIEMDDPQSSSLLLRHCHVPRMNHLTRSVFPCDLQRGADIHDRITKDTFSAIIGLEQMDDIRWKQASMKVKFGGFGLTEVQCLSSTAFAAAWLHSVNVLPARFPSLKGLVDNLCNLDSESNSIGVSLRQSIESLSPWYSSEGLEPEHHTLHELSLNPKKLQHRLTMEISQANTADFIAKQTRERDIARMRSLQGRGAGAWLEAIPVSDKYAMEPSEFRLASCMRLGQAMPFGKWIDHCDCGCQLDEEGYHLLTCKRGGGPVWSHNRILSVWSECLNDLQIHHKKEPRNRYTETDDRPDIVVFDTDNGKNIDLDISLAHPWRRDVIKLAARDQGFAAKRREDRQKEN